MSLRASQLLPLETGGQMGYDTCDLSTLWKHDALWGPYFWKALLDCRFFCVWVILSSTWHPVKLSSWLGTVSQNPCNSTALPMAASVACSCDSHKAALAQFLHIRDARNNFLTGFTCHELQLTGFINNKKKDNRAAMSHDRFDRCTSIFPIFLCL